MLYLCLQFAGFCYPYINNLVGVLWTRRQFHWLTG